MSRGRRLAARLAPAALLALLVAALLAPAAPALELASPNRTRTSELRAALARVPVDGLVVIGFDPDLGTYAEIRPTVRALLADLVARRATMAFVSLTPEGRALALAELDRLRDADASPERLVDLRFHPGAEAALVRLVERPLDADLAAQDAAPLAERGLADAALAVVVGGGDLGPRSWVEQVATRLPELPIVAITPTVLLPELQPYLASGQLDALLGTIRDGAAYRATVDGDRRPPLVEERPIGPLPVLAGMLVAVGVLGLTVGARLRGALRGLTARGDHG
jgi:hypothetical protein